jgi:hypothetical protein
MFEAADHRRRPARLRPLDGLEVPAPRRAQHELLERRIELHEPPA